MIMIYFKNRWDIMAYRSGCFNAMVFGVISPKMSKKKVNTMVTIGITMAVFVISN